METVFREILSKLQIRITKFDAGREKSVQRDGRWQSPANLAKDILNGLGPQAIKYPEIWELCHDVSALKRLCERIAEEKPTQEEKQVQVPPEYSHLTLNLDESHKGREPKFFMTQPDERPSMLSGWVYVKASQMSEKYAFEIARKVIPEYMPRNPPGVSQMRVGTEMKNVLNTYHTPEWMNYEGETPDELPTLFKKLIDHLFPIAEEKEYFFSWLHDSLFTRSFVYLILCGLGGVGKNRLKLVMRALHGFENAVDGKKSTLKERFNAQIADNTLVWFDELHYDMDMENSMKEIQNDSISIERKSVDATRSTRIYASCVISNNKPRDNYIAFDARKFVPLTLNVQRLDASMTNEEIEELTGKVQNETSSDYDIAFVAQIGRWIQKHGRSEKWPTLEYKGPMFYKLAHTSMTRWQKKAALLILEANPDKPGSRLKYDAQKGFLWSSVEEASQKKSGDRLSYFPDYSSIQYFFDIFVDAEGARAFKTELVQESIVGDFWVKVLNSKPKIFTEAEVNRATIGQDKPFEQEEYLELL